MRLRAGRSIRRGRRRMSMCKSLAVVVSFGLVLSAAVAAEQPGLGKPVTEADLALWDISVGPDGAGLARGSGTPVQGSDTLGQNGRLSLRGRGKGGRNAALNSTTER